LDDEVDAESEVIVGSATAKARAFDVFALDAGLATATCSVCTAERLAVPRAALSCVGLTKVVGNCVTLLPASVICTLEQGRKFVPVTTTENPGVPAVAAAGETAVIVGTDSVAVETVKEAAAEFTPALDTVIDAVPALAMSEAGIAAVSCVALTNAVARGDPFQLTTEAFTKFVPVTASVKPDGLHDGVLLVDVVDDDSEVIAGARIAKGIPLEVPPPGPCVTTPTEALPAPRKSEAGTVAVSCVALIKVVVRVDFTFAVLVHCTVEHGSRFVPVTVRVMAELPAGADVWDNALIAGAAKAVAGVEIVNGKLPEVPFEFVTVMDTGAAKDTKVAGIAAVSCVALTKVVGCAVPFQFTTASFVKFVPFTVSVKPVGLQ
jgi:hypothetical protein